MCAARGGPPESRAEESRVKEGRAESQAERRRGKGGWRRSSVRGRYGLVEDLRPLLF